MNQPDLKGPVEEVTSQIEAAMISVYSFQTALINAHGSNTPELRAFFTSLRKRLKAEWEDIREFFQSMHGFGGDVVVLKDAFGTETDEDCIEFLSEMSATSASLLKRSEELSSKTDQTAKSFVSQTTEFEMTVRQAAPHEPDDPFQSHDEQLTQFVNAIRDASHPDGLKALESAKEALTRVHSALQKMVIFWKLTTLACESFVLRGRIRINNLQAASLGETWQGYQTALLRSISSISKSCDAVVVHALGSPSGRIDQGSKQAITGPPNYYPPRSPSPKNPSRARLPAPDPADPTPIPNVPIPMTRAPTPPLSDLERQPRKQARFYRRWDRFTKVIAVLGLAGLVLIGLSVGLFVAGR